MNAGGSVIFLAMAIAGATAAANFTVTTIVSQRRPFYVVTSPESSGNRFTVSLMLSAGCYGVAGHQQPFDEPRRHGAAWPNHVNSALGARSQARCFVAHRSMPHNGVWVDLPMLVGDIRRAGMEPRILVPHRPEHVVIPSQVKQRHVRTARQAEDNVARAHRTLATALGALPDVWFQPVLYEQLGDERYLHWLFDRRMNLPLPHNHPQFQDRDSKHNTT